MHQGESNMKTAQNIILVSAFNQQEIGHKVYYWKDVKNWNKSSNDDLFKLI